MDLPRLTFVTGKGGSGKSTVAAALACALARHRPTSLADLDQRCSAARIFGVDLNGHDTARVAEDLELCALSPRKELEHFIERIVPLKAISRRMLGSRTFGYVTAALPGLEGFLLLERLRMMAGQAAMSDRYVVIDGPASGTTRELLSLAAGVGRLAPAGTLNRLSSQLEDFLHDPQRFGVLIVLRPEELALREAIETAAELRKLQISVVASLINSVAEPLFTDVEIDQTKSLGAEHSRLVSWRAELTKAADRARSELARASLAAIELPMLFEAAIGKTQIAKLSRMLEPILELR